MDKQVLERAIPFIDSWLRYRFERLEMPGFVVAIAHEGRVVFKQAYGYANLERKEPMSTNHVFRIASHSKTFTATSLMQLAERDLLNIDEPVVHYLPWLAKHRDKRMRHITARQLMSHGAGVVRDGDGNFWQLAKPFPDADQFKNEIMNADLVIDNNQQMKYSNFGYTLLGLLIEAITKMPYHRYVKKNIVQPLGLRNTGPEFTEDILPKLVTGYARRDLDKKRMPFSGRMDTKAMAAATGFYSTASDMCAYFNAHITESGKLLTDESKKEMQRAQWRLKNSRPIEEYGLGFSIDYVGERKLIGHGGGFPGQITRTLCDCQEKLIVVALTNCIDGEPKMMSKGIVSVINHFESSARQSDAKASERLKRFQGRFMQLWCDLEIVENGRKLIAVNPNTWFPFGEDQEIQVLERIDDVTLKIKRAGGYSNEGELVTYNFDDRGTVKSIRFGGYEMLPEPDYNKKVAKIKAKRKLLEMPD